MRIGELAARAGISTATVRFYERSGVLTAPVRNQSGYRDYPERALTELQFVRAGQAIGLTLLELSEIAAFRDRGEAPCAELLALMERRLAEVEQRLVELERMRRDLTVLVAAAHDQNLDDCPPSTMYGLIAPGTSGRTT